MPRFALVLLVLTAGASLAVQPAVNAQLGRYVTSLGAAFVSLAGSALLVGILLVASGNVGELRGASAISPLYLIGGLFGVLNVTVTLIAVSRLGVGSVVAITVTSQLIVAGILDRFGLIGIEQADLTAPRVVGYGLLLAGVALVTLQ